MEIEYDHLHDLIWFGSWGDGLVSFVRHGRNLHVVGGLIAPEEAKDGLLASFLEFARANRRRACLYNVVPEEMGLFRRHGCQLTKLGEEPIVDLTRTTWRGKAYEWVRRQENYCLRRGLAVRELVPQREPDYRDRLAAELNEKLFILQVGIVQLGISVG